MLENFVANMYLLSLERKIKKRKENGLVTQLSESDAPPKNKNPSKRVPVLPVSALDS